MKKTTVAAFLTIALASCGTQTAVQPENQLSQTQNSAIIVQSRSSANGEVSVDALTIAQADVLKHTFSDGNQATFYRLGENFFMDGSAATTGYSSALDMKQTLSRVEQQHAAELAGSEVSTQAVGLIPGATDGWGDPALWPSAKERGVIYYDFDPQYFPPAAQQGIKEGIAEWNRSNVQVKLVYMRENFENSFANPKYKYLTITGGSANTFGSPVLSWMKNQPCSVISAFTSGIGYQNSGIDVASTIYFNKNCEGMSKDYYKATVQHELGHVVGLYHEMSHCGRSQFINVTYSSPMAWYDVPAKINTLEACGPGYQNYGPYDYSSIMHYGYGTQTYMSTSVTFAQKVPTSNNYCGNPSVVGLPRLSPNDIKAINYMYGRGPAVMGCS